MEQKKNSVWYFHKQNGKSYKNGSFKGLDISCGHGENYGGILIRSISEVSNSIKEENLIEGPSKTVDKILELCKVNHIKDLVDLLPNNIFTKSILYLQPIEELKDIKQIENNILISPRVGLTLKKTKNLEYIMKPYRFLNCKQIKKAQCLIALANNLNIKKTWKNYFNSGKTKTAKYFLEDNPALNTVELLCQLY